MSAALKLAPEQPDRTKAVVEQPEPEQLNLTGSGRAHAVAMFRRVADQLASGELDAAFVQWTAPRTLLDGSLHTETEMVTATLTVDDPEAHYTMRIRTYTISEG